MKRSLILLLLFFVIAQRSFAGDGVVISDAWVREVPPGATVSAGYMTIQNKANSDDKLTLISSDAAEAVELHRSSVDDNGVATMERVQVLDLSVDEIVELKPGGMHLMLIGLKESLVGKESVIINLNFVNSGTVRVEAPVKNLKDSDATHHH